MSTTIEHETQQPVVAVASKTTTALAVVTKSIQEINALETAIGALDAKYKGVVFQVNTTQGMDDAKKARAAVREPRYAIQNMAKQAKGTLNDLKDSIDEQASALIERITAIEGPIHLQVTSEETRKANEKKANAEAESRRVAEIQGRIDALRNSPTDAVGKSSEEVGQFIQTLESTAIDDSFAELRAQAEGAKSTALVRLRMMHAAAVNLETEQQRLADERERLDREKAEQDEAAAKERARLAAEQRAQDAIRIIQDRVHTAAEADSLEGYDLALSVTQGESITEGRFGSLIEMAAAAKAGTISTLQARRVSLEKRLAEERELARQREEQEAENARIKAAQDARDAEAAEQRRLQDEENERIRLRNEMALQEISAIHHQLIIADVGRAPYCKGGDLESYDWVISETEKWPITEEQFGALTASAQRVKDSTLATLRKQRGELIDRLQREAAAQVERDRLAAERAESDRKETERVAAAQAEEKRIADERAQLEREQAELRAKQEAAATPVSAPVPEAPAPIAETPAVIATTCNPCDAQDEREAAGVARHIDIVFDGPPGSVAGRFVEVEDERGHSIHIGEWIERGDGCWALRIPRS